MAEQAPPQAQPKTQSVCVVAVPFPAQGHLNQLLHFSLHLSSLHIPVHFASSSTHSLQAKTRLQGWASASLSRIHFHHLPLPPFTSPSPDPTSPYKFPSHLLPSFEASMHECLHWLDKQPAESVVYVSFGSTVSISDEQIEQLALGLLHSRQRFIWVLKDADKGDIFADNDNSTEQRKLLSGFKESTTENGLIVRGWAPQLEILAHPSTGVFVSHCGWNSCIESLSFGVPMIAWPMHSDQPRNAMMVCEYLKVGVLVRDWDRRKETVSGPEVERAIERVMGTDDEGKEIRKMAKGLGEGIRGAVKENGSSRVEFDSFVQHITRL